MFFRESTKNPENVQAYQMPPIDCREPSLYDHYGRHEEFPRMTIDLGRPDNYSLTGKKVVAINQYRGTTDVYVADKDFAEEVERDMAGKHVVSIDRQGDTSLVRLVDEDGNYSTKIWKGDPVKLEDS